MCHDERLAATSGVLQDDFSCLMLLSLQGSQASRITYLSNTSTRSVSQRALELHLLVEATLERLLEFGDAVLGRRSARHSVYFDVLKGSFQVNSLRTRTSSNSQSNLYAVENQIYSLRGSQSSEERDLQAESHELQKFASPINFAIKRRCAKWTKYKTRQA